MYLHIDTHIYIYIYIYTVNKYCYNPSSTLKLHTRRETG